MNPHDARNEPLEQWLDRVVDQYQNGLVRYAQQFVGDGERARDIVQDTFMKLCDHDREHARLQGTSLPKWLFTVCRNRAIDVSRKEKRMKLAPSDHFADQVSASKSPESAALDQERQAELLSQIMQLPGNQQEVLRLKFHGGLSYQEIAEITGLTRGNVGFLLHTAIAKLRQRVTT